MYILTYEHGGYVLWGDHLKPRLKNIATWLEKYPKLKIGLDYESFTFDSSVKDPDIHRVAMSYNMMPSATKTEKGQNGLNEYKFADFKTDGETVLTALYPENGAILARFCNFSESQANATLSTEYGKVTKQVDLLGKEIKTIENGKLNFGKWEIKTVKVEQN